MGVFFITICVILLVFSVKYFKKICNPISNYSIIFILAGLLFIKDEYLAETIKEKGFFFLIIGTFIFTGSFLLANLLKKNERRKYTYNLRVVNKLINFIIITSLISIALSLYEILNISGSIKNIIFNSTWVRIQYLNRPNKVLIGIIGNFSNMTTLVLTPLFSIAYINNLKNIKLKLGLVITLRLILSIITMSKDSFLIFFFLLLIAFIENIRKINLEIKFLIKKGIYFVGVIIFLLLIIALQRSYIGTRYESYLEAVFGTVERYLYLPLEAFSKLISSSNDIIITKGRYSFRPIFNMFSYFGFGERISIIQDAVVTKSGNVYTMFGTMYRDFKEMGIIFVSIIYGIFCGSMYSRNNQRKLSKIYINSLVGMVLFFSYYDFKFIQTVYVLTIFYAIILEKILFSKLYFVKTEKRRK